LVFEPPDGSFGWSLPPSFLLEQAARPTRRHSAGVARFDQPALVRVHVIA
jgi:hypothetical protein